MIPNLVNRITKVTALTAGAALLYLLLMDWRAGVVFGSTVAWMMANFWVWTGIYVFLFCPGVSRKGLKLSGLFVAKFALLIGGLLVLKRFSPYSRHEAMALAAGVSLIFVIAGLKALGARMTGRDFVTGLPAKKSHIAAALSIIALLGLSPSLLPAQGEAAESHHAKEAATEVHGAAGHPEEAESPELPNFIGLLLHTPIKDTATGHFLHVYEKQIIMVVVVSLMALFIFGTLGLRAAMPGKLQTLLEMTVEGLYGFIAGVMGDRGKKYTPFLATLFMFILINNLMGIVPLFASATSKFQTTVTLALIAFVYIQFNGIREAGIVHYIHHLMGSPKDLLGWCMAPLLLPLEIIGTLAKPLSLSLRLFGNLMGEDILIGVFLMLGISLMGVVWHDPWFGVPLHLPFLFLALLTSVIQALVFTLLCTIYLMMLMPHHEHDDHKENSNWHPEHKPEMPGMPEDRTLHIGADAAPFV